MKKSIILAIFFTLVFSSESWAVVTKDSLNVPVFGKVYIYNRTTTPQNVIIMISGDGGWKFGVVGFSETFSDMNTLVIGVDILRYFKNLRQRTDDCYNVCSRFCTTGNRGREEIRFP